MRGCVQGDDSSCVCPDTSSAGPVKHEAVVALAKIGAGRVRLRFHRQHPPAPAEAQLDAVGDLDLQLPLGPATFQHRWGGGRWGTGTSPTLEPQCPNSRSAVLQQDAHQLAHPVVPCRLHLVEAHSQVLLALGVEDYQLCQAACHTQPCHLRGHQSVSATGMAVLRGLRARHGQGSVEGPAQWGQCVMDRAPRSV